MVKRVFKWMCDYEKEERWLNEMAAHGWMMKSFFLGVYHFEEGIPGEYHYRIDLLPKVATHIDSQRYMQFMEEAGVEVVDTWVRWAYFRRKASEGAFDVYTDIDSKIAHFDRVFLFLFPACCIEWVCSLMQLLALTTTFMVHHHFRSEMMINFFAFALCFLFGIFISKAAWSAYKHGQRLKKEKALHE